MVHARWVRDLSRDSQAASSSQPLPDREDISSTTPGLALCSLPLGHPDFSADWHHLCASCWLEVEGWFLVPVNWADAKPVA